MVLRYLLTGGAGARGAGDLTYAWTDLGQDTVLAALTTQSAKISRATWWGGKLFLGCGSINETAHPLPARYYDPGDGTFKSLTDDGLSGGASTDAFYAHMVMNNFLWLFGGDAVGSPSWDYAKVSSALSASVHNTDPPFAEHIYDACLHTDGAIYVAGMEGVGGANPNKPTVWKTADLGTTWTTAHQDTTSGGDWFTFIFSLGGKLWVQPCNSASGPSGNARSSPDGATWTTQSYKINATGRGGRVVLCGGYAVMHTDLQETGTGSCYRFDGTQAGTNITSTALDGFNVQDICADSGYAYVMTHTDRIWRSADALAWTQVATLPVGLGRSLEVNDGAIYVGATNAHVWKGTPSAPESRTFWVDSGGAHWVDNSGNFWLAT